MPSIYGEWGHANRDLYGDGTPDVIVKVGPKGYIHGWIYVGPPGVGAAVHHPKYGKGTVHRNENGKTHVRFESGKKKAFEVGKETPTPEHFEKRPRTARARAANPVPRKDTADGAQAGAKTPTKHGKHDQLVRIGNRAAELAQDSNIRPLLGDKDLGLKRGEITALVRAGYITRRDNMLGDAIALTDKGHAYLAAHRGDERDQKIVGEIEALRAERATLEGQQTEYAQDRSSRYSGELSRLTGQAIRENEAREYALHRERAARHAAAPAADSQLASTARAEDAGTSPVQPAALAPPKAPRSRRPGGASVSPTSAPATNSPAAKAAEYLSSARGAIASGDTGAAMNYLTAALNAAPDKKAKAEIKRLRSQLHAKLTGRPAK